MIITLIYWLALWLSLGLAGYLLKQIFRFDKTKWSFFNYIWMGYALLTGYLQIVSLSTSLNDNFVFGGWIIISFWALLLWENKGKIEIFSGLIYKISKNWKYICFVIAIIILGLYSSTKVVTWYDTYLYHFNMVHWNRDYGVVPGLANFHDRLGFNSSFLVTTAFVERFLGYGESAFILNGFLLVTVVLQYGWMIFSKNKNWIIKIFAILILPYLIFRLGSTETASLSTDLAMASIALALVAAVLERINFGYIIVLAALITTVKLSGILSFLIVLLLFFKKEKRREIKWQSLVLAGLILVSFMGRNIILSGYPLYPSTWLGVKTGWLIAPDLVKTTSTNITAWARMPNNDCLNSLKNGFFYWGGPWWETVKNSWEIKLLAAAILFLIIYGRIFFKKDNLPTISVIFFCLASLGLMFLMAPDFRFGSIFFWILGTMVATEIIIGMIPNEGNQEKTATIICILMLAFFAIPKFEIDQNKPVLWNYNQRISSTEIQETNMADGTPIFEPVEGDRCGNEQLLCTAYNKGIELIDKNNIRKGFKRVKEN